MKRVIRDSAKGRDCSVNGTSCLYTTDTTVLAHLPFNSGMGLKSFDLSACYACYNCHQMIDRVVIDDEFERNREWYLRRANMRTLKIMYDGGIIRVCDKKQKGDIEIIDDLKDITKNNQNEIHHLLDVMALCWSDDFNDIKSAEIIRSITREYGYCIICRDYCNGECE